MGNVCGCVREQKEECYVDPKKAPLRLELKEVKGRRYFQRKKRKSDFLQPVEPLHSPACEAASIRGEPQNDPDWNLEEETHVSREESLSRGPVFIVRDSQHQPHEDLTPQTSTDQSRSTGGNRLRAITTTSMVAPGREVLLDKELMRHQLRRSASFSSVSRNEETFAKIIWDWQASRRRRASSCSGCIQHDPVSADHKVNL